ncbi:MAG: ABC transporter ATP-binding protein [Clostridiales bacterium]|nr:ABC transporter ATP-binding protein [Candidatus Cacconaster stercorequi]
MLEIRDLHVQFRDSDHECVRGINLTVGDGEIVGLVGESGSGKTVTAMMVSGLLKSDRVITHGDIILDGCQLLSAGDETLQKIQGRDICVVFQEPMSAMNPVMRIGPQVEECLRVHTDLSKAERRERALQALRDVELNNVEEIYRKYPHELSGGMLQRVMIAAAILPNPKLLLADEPTTALDVTIQAQILELLKRLNRERGMSVLFISHNLNVVRKLCTRVAVMEKGQIVEDGATDQVFYHPQAPYTQKLIAAIPTRSKRRGE